MTFDTFWFNTVDNTSSFEEPDWQNAWKKRVERSRRISNIGLWIEYFDPKLNAEFVYNKTTTAYVWKQFDEKGKEEA